MAAKRFSESLPRHPDTTLDTLEHPGLDCAIPPLMGSPEHVAASCLCSACPAFEDCLAADHDALPLARARGETWTRSDKAKALENRAIIPHLGRRRGGTRDRLTDPNPL